MKHNIAFGSGHFFTTANALQTLLCLAPAISAPISSEKQFCLLNYQVHRRQQYGVLIPDSGFPTPGSPTSIGLFWFDASGFARRRISSSRPITGSSFSLWLIR
jgi:hypothetical protein